MICKPRILFVDDEIRVLESLEDLLRKHSRRWSMRFVGGGPAARALLGAETFDVVVTDLRMPVVDGFALLDDLRLHHPRTVRLVLSGDPRRETAVKLVPHAHRALVKPCRAGELEAAIESACMLSELVADDALRATIGRIRELPALPQNAARLQSALADDRCTYSDIAAIASSDIALSANILKVANSPLFGSGRVVLGVADAVARVGTEVIRTIVLSEGVFGRHELPAIIRTFAQELHYHSKIVASVAMELTTDAQARREAFAAAMLHDIGCLLLALNDPEDGCEGSFVRIPSAHGGAPPPDHARVGAYLLGLWGLPASMIEAVARHHDADLSTAPLSAQLVARAEEIVSDLSSRKRPTDGDVERMLEKARDVALHT